MKFIKPNAMAAAVAFLSLWGASRSFGAPATIMFFKFENSLLDQSASPHAASLVGNPTFETNAPALTDGPVSIRLDGQGSGIVITNAVDLNVNSGNPFSITTWIKTDFNDGERVIAAKSPPSGNVLSGAGGTHTAALFVDEDGALRYDNFWVDEVHSVALVRNGQWMHVAVTYDGETYRLYVNGFPDNEKVFSGVNEGDNGEPPWQFTIGYSLNTEFPGGAFQGNIDDFAFWNAALTAEQVLNIRARRMPITITTQPANVSVLTASTATFSVVATVIGSTPDTLRYQWQKDGVDIPGATNSSYTTAALTSAFNGSKYQVVLSANDVSLISQTATLIVDQGNIVPGPIAYWNFENTLEDQSLSRTHSGNLEGAGTFNASVPNATAGANSILLDGASQITVTNAADLKMNTGQAFTITAWIRTTSANGLIVAKSPPSESVQEGDSGTHTPALFVDGEGKLRYDVFLVEELHSNASVNDGLWKHVAVTYDGATYRLYINGQFDISGAFSGANEGINNEPSWKFTIGQSFNKVFPDAHFTGNIDEVAFWSVALSDIQILNAFSLGVPKDAPIITIAKQPADAFILLPGAANTASFAVEATVAGAPAESVRYRWQRDGTDIPGATNAVYTTPALDTAFNGAKYRAFVSSGSVFVMSSEARLLVVQSETVPDPIAWLNFEGTLNDQGEGTNQHNGTFQGAAQIETNSPNTTAGSASLLLDGEDSGVILAQPSDLNMNDGAAFSITAWIRTDFAEGERVIVGKSPPSENVIAGEAGTHTAALFVDEDGKLRYDNFWISEVHSRATVRNGQWTHAAVTYNGASFRLYVNGQFDNSDNFTGSNEGASGEPVWEFTIGESLNRTFPGGIFKGNIDEVAFWNVPLSDGQIAVVFRNGIPGTGPVQPELTFQRAGDQLILSWTEPGFVLQENNDLTNSTGWKDVAGAGNSPVSVVIETAGHKYFRLRK